MHYAWILSIVLGMAMGAEIGEVDLACHPLVGTTRLDIKAQGEAWFVNWMTMPIPRILTLLPQSFE